eukprot:gene4409-4662_t
MLGSGGASDAATSQMVDLLQSRLGQAVLHLPDQELSSLLVNDVYKIRMQNVYSQFMTGVRVEFVLNIRRCISAERTVLGEMREQQPAIFQELTERVCRDLQQLKPLDDRVIAALQEFHDFTPPQASLQVLLERLNGPDRGGVAAVDWIELDGNPTLVAAGSIEAASNAETSCMQAVQEAIVLAGAEGLTRNHLGLLLDRTERLACSLGKMVGVVEQLNALPHEFQILLMAGTSSVLAVSLLRPLLAADGLDQQQRRAFVGKLLGTHAHEMTSVTQQLLAGYDAEAGRRSATALPDTFTTQYFATVAAMTPVPEEFIGDMQQRWGEVVSPGSRVFDLLRVWRLDSGNYPELAALLRQTWSKRCHARQAGGLPELPPLRFMHSNISSIEDIKQAVQASAPASSRKDESALWPTQNVSGDTPMTCRASFASQQACAVKLGDGSMGGKVQLDPRLSKDVQRTVLQGMQRMVQAGAELVAERHADILGRVLRKMYVDVVHKQLLFE